MVGLRDWFESAPEPELPPVHAAWCHTHGIHYRGPFCAFCRERAASERTLAELKALEARESEQMARHRARRQAARKRRSRAIVEAIAGPPRPLPDAGKARGGFIGGIRRAQLLSPERRREIAKMGSLAAAAKRRERESQP